MLVMSRARLRVIHIHIHTAPTSLTCCITVTPVSITRSVPPEHIAECCASDLPISPHLSLAEHVEAHELQVNTQLFEQPRARGRRQRLKHLFDLLLAPPLHRCLNMIRPHEHIARIRPLAVCAVRVRVGAAVGHADGAVATAAMARDSDAAVPVIKCVLAARAVRCEDAVDDALLGPLVRVLHLTPDAIFDGRQISCVLLRQHGFKRGVLRPAEERKRVWMLGERACYFLHARVSSHHQCANDARSSIDME